MSKTGFVQPKLKDIPFSEAEVDFDIEKVPSQVRHAVEAARKNAGVVEVDRDFEASATPAQREARRLQSLRLERKGEKIVGAETPILAKYKIELVFEQGRTSLGPNLVGVSIWESGKLFNGGGDESMFFCKDGTVPNGQGCWAPIPNSQVRGEVAYCTSCNNAINASKLTIQKRGKFDTKKLCIELVKLFRQLESNADIYVKFHKTDPHYIAMERAKGKEVAGRLKGMAIYPLKNILKDTAAGAALEKRFFSFLSR